MITVKIIKLINYVFKNVETQYELTVQVQMEKLLWTESLWDHSFYTSSSSSSRWERRILRLNGSLYGISVIRLMKWWRVTLQIVLPCYEMPKVVCCPFRNLIFQYWFPFSWHGPLVLTAIGLIVSLLWIIKNNVLKGLRLCKALKFKKGMQHFTYCSAMKKVSWSKCNKRKQLGELICKFQRT